MLSTSILKRLNAGSLVVVVQDSDEVMTVQAAKEACRNYLGIESGDTDTGELRVVDGASPDSVDLLEQHSKRGKGGLIMVDYLACFADVPTAVRAVRAVATQAATRSSDQDLSFLILVESPATDIPQILQGDIEIIRTAIPSVAELQEELELFLSEQEQGTELDGNGEARYAVASAVAGLARHEAARLFALSVTEGQPLYPKWLREEKARKVAERLDGALSFESTDCPEVGGLSNLRDWLKSRKKAFCSAKAKAFGLPEPKGLLLLGLPGGGKSLTARRIAKDWGLPLLRFDASKVFGSLVGQSEQQMREALGAAEACSPCVLWLDEIEKAFAGNSGGGSSGDSGTTRRVFGQFLTWMQEKQKPVFVVATANDVSSLPPELLRKGRFDEIFFVGLPTQEERSEIVKIHLAKRDRSMSKNDVSGIAQACDGFTGAEIEQAIIDGLFSAFNDPLGNDLTASHVKIAASATAPISKTMSEKIQALESWAQGRARQASSASATNNKPARRRARIKKGT